MTRQAAAAAVLACSIAGLAAALAAGPGGAAHRRYTIAYATYVTSTEPGGREAARRLGVRIVYGRCQPCTDAQAIRRFRSLIARHVDAIVVDGFDPGLKPVFREIRRAGILLISSGDDIAAPRDLWVSQTDDVAYAEALADALASQLGGTGEYAILEEGDEFPVATRWADLAAAYIAKAYPDMKSDGVVVGTGAGDQTEVDSVKSYLAAHPNLRGLIGITPTETYMAAEAITQSGRIGQIFSAGNGGSGLGGRYGPAPFARSGAAELVYGADPRKLGYLTVWAAHYLLAGHRFRAGAYEVGGPVGLVYYYPGHRELRLGQPLTITKKNVARYEKKF